MADDTTKQMPPIKLAFIIDNVVTDILHTDERLAAIFLSEPVILDITDRMNTSEAADIVPNSVYDPETDTFTSPDKAE